MAAKHGITTDTYKYFLIDSGAIYKNYGQAGEALIGATRGGASFSIEQEFREMEVDGAHGAVVGDRRIIKVIPKITATFVEIKSSTLLLALPGAVSSNIGSPQTHYQLTRSAQIASTDYLTNIAIVGQISGSSSKYIECIIRNALADGNLEMSFSDKDESVLKVTFQGNFSPTDLATEPWTINFPTIP